MIPEWAASGPNLFIFLFFAVFFRAQGTYWLGRLTARGALSASHRQGIVGAIGRWFEGPIPRKGATLLDRWGMILIPLSFLTVGVQTAVNAGAGIVAMKWRTYTLAMLPGCVLWALLYGLGLLAIWTAAIAAIAGSTAGRVTILILVLALVARILLRRRKRGALAPAPRPVID